jgi:hypothetical protein
MEHLLVVRRKSERQNVYDLGVLCVLEALVHGRDNRLGFAGAGTYEDPAPGVDQPGDIGR